MERAFGACILATGAGKFVWHSRAIVGILWLVAARLAQSFRKLLVRTSSHFGDAFVGNARQIEMIEEINQR